jgi:hypothetical protein
MENSESEVPETGLLIVHFVLSGTAAQAGLETNTPGIGKGSE